MSKSNGDPKTSKDARTLARELRETRKQLRDLVAAAEAHIAEVDRLGRLPSTPERGRLLANSTNGLELAKDAAKRFGLGRRK